MARGSRGTTEVVTTRAGNVYSKQTLKSGQVVYRKNGRFASKRAFAGARGSKESTEIFGAAFRAPTPRGERTEDTAWIRADGTAGDLAPQILPYLKPGDDLTNREIRVLKNERRLDHSFQGFWRRNPQLSREEAALQFSRFFKELRAARSAFDRDRIREEFGLSPYESFR